MELWKIGEDGKLKKEKLPHFPACCKRKPFLGFVLIQFISPKTYGKRWIVFSKREEEKIDALAKKFLSDQPRQGSRFLSVLLSPIKQAYTNPPSASYVAEDMTTSAAEAAESGKFRLAIRLN